MIEAWAAILWDLTIEEIKQGLWNYMRENSDIPTPSDILKIVQSRDEPSIQQLLRFRENGMSLSKRSIDRLATHDEQN